LAELQQKLKKSQQPGAQGKGYTRQSLQNHADKLSAGQYIHEILRVKVSQRRGRLRLSYHTDAQALHRLTVSTLGKRILFTDNHNWSNKRIIRAYRSQHHVEAAFRTMKNPHFLGWDPMHHWTDQKIRVHALYCGLALTLAGLLHRQVRQAGLEVSWEASLEELSSIEEVINLFPPAAGSGGRLHAVTTYTEGTPLSLRLADLFRLSELKAN
jgi:transposase